MATEVEIDAVINTDRSDQGLRQLSKSLRELVSLQGQIGDKGSDQFKKLQKAINDTEGQIGDLNDSFKTLRGSGVERTNASLGLLREGFLSADPEKLSIGMKGLGAAMKAIPIFLLIEGARLLFENWEKVAAIFSDSAKQFKLNEEALKDLNEQVSINKVQTDALLITKNSELKALQAQGGKYDEIIKKIKEIDELNQSKLRGDLSLTDKEIQNQIFKLNELKNSFENKSTTESILQFFGVDIGTTEKDLKEAERALTQLSLKRGEADNKILAETANTSEKIAEIRRAETKAAQEEYEKQKALGVANATEFNRLLGLKQEYEEAVNAARIADAQAQSDKEVAIVAKQIQDENNVRSYLRNEGLKQEEEINKKAEGKRRLKSENDKAQLLAFQNETLANRINFIEQDRETQLLNENLTQKQRIAIIEKAENDILQLKIKKAQEGLTVAKAGADALNSINALVTQNESQQLLEQSHQKDYALENDANRTQEALDREELKKNQLLNNDSLTAEQRAQIAYDSETRQIEIANASKNAQNKLNADYAKKELEIKKDQFNRNKALQIATGVINTAASVLQTIASVPYPANIPLAILAGIAGAAQVALISSQKFDAGRTSAPPPANIDTRGGLSSSSSTSPIQQNTQGSVSPLAFDPTKVQNAQGNTNTRVYVLESDITSVQGKVSVIESRSNFR